MFSLVITSYNDELQLCLVADTYILDASVQVNVSRLN